MRVCHTHSRTHKLDTIPIQNSGPRMWQPERTASSHHIHAQQQRDNKCRCANHNGLKTLYPVKQIFELDIHLGFDSHNFFFQSINPIMRGCYCSLIHLLTYGLVGHVTEKGNPACAGISRSASLYCACAVVIVLSETAHQSVS